MAALEDVYLPFRPKRRTRAMIAKERGLEPLAELILRQAAEIDPDTAAAAFVTPEGSTVAEDLRVPDVAAALQARGTSSPSGSTTTPTPGPGFASSSSRRE